MVVAKAQIGKRLLMTGLLAATVGGSTGASALRNCDPDLDSDVFRGSSRYLIGELEFQELGGDARGTETHYNYTNTGESGVAECHVTYATSGIYDASSALFLIDTTLTGHSHGCDAEVINARYPDSMTYTLQVSFGANDMVDVLRAESGEMVGSGIRGDGVLSYKTDEVCELH